MKPQSILLSLAAAMKNLAAPPEGDTARKTGADRSRRDAQG
jgi:hypothetical protein